MMGKGWRLMFIFGCLDLLQILRILAAFLFAVLCSLFFPNKLPFTVVSAQHPLTVLGEARRGGGGGGETIKAKV